MESINRFGRFWVVPTPTAISRIAELLTAARDRLALEHHLALLAHFPDASESYGTTVLE
ncbi:hypothetical protein [Schlesneria paludicola]|uniref:hypothetical protein n=1 Tax=Schlesneria paludicola TaxID=360056 RepID=UPI0002F14FD1|nr:hypothetical protein [Schlesneria paludicola]